MNKNAFTLIEIIIVVVLLGILAAIVMPQFSSSSDDARTNAQATDIRAIQGQIHLYQAKVGSYPPNLATLVPDYMLSLPTDPVSGGAYVYDSGAGIVSAP